MVALEYSSQICDNSIMHKRSSNQTKDINILAANIVGSATKEAEPEKSPASKKKNKAAVALGRLGGIKGGKARAEKLTPEERKEIARKAAKARWKDKTEQTTDKK